MAKIEMTLSGVSHSEDSFPLRDITLATETDGVTVDIIVDDTAKTVRPYSIFLIDFSIHKKMYQPTEIIADISIAPASGKDSDYKEISRKKLEDLFKHTRVSLKEGAFSIGDDFYVHEVLPHYKSDSMRMTLKIYSLDKLLTVKEASRTFVCKKLGEDILKTEIPKYVTPWTIDRKIPVLEKNIKKNDEEISKLSLEILNKSVVKELTEEEKAELEEKRKTDSLGAKILEAKYALRMMPLTAEEVAAKEKERTQLLQEKSDWKTEKDKREKAQKRMTYGTDNMRFLNYKTEKVKGNDGVERTVRYEHIFPYLVQYNESFYDMLARTTNRWGEFLYYENGTLNVGYNDTAAPIAIDKKHVQDISYCDLNAKYLTLATDGKYDYEADNSGLTGKPLQKSPVIVKAQMGDFGGKADKWIMKQIATVFKNEKNLPSMITGMLIDNLFNLAMAKSSVAKLNSDFDGIYFPDSDKPGREEQYGQWNFANKKKGEDDKYLDGFQQFSELGTIFDGNKYKDILKKEQSVGKDAISINFGTTHPELKLGNIISFNGENFIVVEIIGGYDANRSLTFQVIGTAQDKKDKIFYPAVIPEGHVRYANPQPATVTDTDDPTSKNRVRVAFSWQKVEYNDSEDKSKGATAETIQQSTPWLNFASNQNGYPAMGYHYTGNPVMVGFEEGNVERPYVMGGLADDSIFADSVLATPGMHQLTLSDGYGDGMTAFLTGALSPLLGTIMGFVPNLMPKWNWDKSKYFEGGFELTDYYGIYKISGSTDGRNVSISSNWGDVKINAFTGINISAPNGDIKISGKNVTIEAGNNLNLVSGKNVDYKLWKSKDTKMGTWAQMMVDASAQVTKKLASIALGVVDLSLVRSTVEIFFRPVEGALTVKSNRFLKLEAGKAHCDYPEIAYNKEKKLKVLNEANKQSIIDGLTVCGGLVDVFKKIPGNTEKIINKFIEEYNTCVSILNSLPTKIQDLKRYSNGDQAYVADKSQLPCKSYEELKEDLWNQEKDEDWTEDKLAFTDKVKVDDEPLRCVTLSAFCRIYPNHKKMKLQDVPQNYQTIVACRKNYKQQVLDCYNDLRKHIYNLTHLEPDKMAVNKMFHPVILEPLPKDYKQKLITAFSKEKCPKARIYDLTDEDKKLEKKLDNGFVFIEWLYMSRLVSMNLLDEFGFKDNTRVELGADPTAIPPQPGELPVKPKADEKDAEKEDNILNDECWGKYVQSLNALPKLGLDSTSLGGAIVSAVKGEVDAALDNLKFWKGAAERGTWGDGKDGQILFGSGNDTYYLGEKIEKVASESKLRPTLTSLGSGSDGVKDKDKMTLNYWMTKLKKVLIEL